MVRCARAGFWGSLAGRSSTARGRVLRARALGDDGCWLQLGECTPLKVALPLSPELALRAATGL